METYCQKPDSHRIEAVVTSTHKPISLTPTLKDKTRLR